MNKIFQALKPNDIEIVDGEEVTCISEPREETVSIIPKIKGLLGEEYRFETKCLVVDIKK